MAKATPLRNRFRTSRYAAAQPTFSTTGNSFAPAPVAEQPSALSQISTTSNFNAANPNGSTGGSAGDGDGGFGQGGSGLSDFGGLGGLGGVGSSSRGGGSRESDITGFGVVGPNGLMSYETRDSLIGGVLGTLGLGPTFGTIAAKGGAFAGRAQDKAEREALAQARAADKAESDFNDSVGPNGPGPNDNFGGTSRGGEIGDNPLGDLGPNMSFGLGTNAPTNAWGNLGGDTGVTGDPSGNNFGGGVGFDATNSGEPGGSDATGDGGHGGSSGGYGDSSDTSSDSDGSWAVGGRVVGPGGPTDDAVQGNLSNGEYVLSDAQLSAMAQEMFGSPDVEQMRDYLDQFSMEKTGQEPNYFGGEDGFDDDMSEGVDNDDPEMCCDDTSGMQAPMGGASSLSQISTQEQKPPMGMKPLDETQQKIAQSLPLSASPQEMGLLAQNITPEVLAILEKTYGPNMAYMLQPLVNVGANVKTMNRPMITDTSDRIGGTAGPMPPIGQSALSQISAR